MHILERKTRYDGSVSEYDCHVVNRKNKELVLLYEIPRSFHMEAAGRTIHIPSGTVTVGYYWEDRPYNVYHWRTKEGTYFGSYFNLVKDTIISENLVSYVDLIVDLMVFPDGSHVVLDLDELPVGLPSFENGRVARQLQQLIEQKETVIDYLMNETDRLITERLITAIKLS